MEIKKTSQQDIYQYSPALFLLGLLFSLTLSLALLEWNNVRKEPRVPDYNETIPTEFYVKTVQINPSNSQPVPVKPLVKNPVFTPEPHSTEVGIAINRDSTATTINTLVGDSLILPSEPTSTVEIYPEVFPKPIGGLEKFYSYLSNSIQYPRQAIRNQTEGKVFVEFVVDIDGVVTNPKVVKGIGSGCDEEAVRVISKTHWEPGRQRGKPVKVRMVVPIFFRLK